MDAERKWALDVLGVPANASEEQIEQAYLELQAVWEPHKLTGDDWGRARATQELEKIEKARRILGPDAGDVEPASARKPIHPVVLGILVVLAFSAGYFLTRTYKGRHRPAADIVVGPEFGGPAEKVRLNPPNVDVSSSLIGQGALSSDEQAKAQKAIAGLASGFDALQDRDTLEQMGERAIGPVTQALGSPDANTRMNAAMVINAIAAGPDTAPNSDQERAKLRPLFAEAGTIGAMERLAADPNAATRQNVAYGLGNIGDISAFDTLVGMAKDSDADVRSGVAYSLGKLGDLRAMPTLTTLLNDPELSVRETAVEALGRFDNPDAKSALSDRLPKETDPGMISQINAALEGRTSPESGAAEP